MKYMQEGGFGNHPLMRLTLILTLVLLAGFWVTNLGMYFQRMTLDPASVVAYYNGSEADFTPPRSSASMLETSHAHLPMMGMVLLFLTHLLIFVPLSRGTKVAFIVTAFSCAVFQEGAGWLVRFASPAWAPLKVGAFLGLQAALGSLIAVLGVFLLRAGRRTESRARSALTASPREEPVTVAVERGPTA